MDIPSAPADSTAFAIPTISVTFGDNFTYTGCLLTLLTAAVTFAAIFGLVPNCKPPSFTFGQEIFNSSADTYVVRLNCSATNTYFSSVLPAIFARTGTSYSAKNGTSLSIISFTPGF